MVSAPARSRRTKKRQTREQLLAAAFRVFSEHGIVNTRMGDVARAASVAHGTVFLHFSSRDELISEVIWSYSGKIARQLHEMVQAKPTVRDVLEAHVNGLAEFEDFYSRLVSEASQLPQQARSTIFGIQSSISTHLTEAVERQHAGHKRRRADPAMMFNTWIGLLNHYVLNRDVFAPSESVLQRCGPTLVNHYLGLLAH